MAEQRVVHGGTIDAPTTQEMMALFAAMMEEWSVEEYERKKGLIGPLVGGAGTSTAQTTVLVTAQYDWRVERITAMSAGLASFALTFYENQVSPTDMLEAVTSSATGIYSDSFDNTLYVPANTQLVIVASAGTPNDTVSFNLQIKLKRHRNTGGRRF